MIFIGNFNAFYVNNGAIKNTQKMTHSSYDRPFHIYHLNTRLGFSVECTASFDNQSYQFITVSLIRNLKERIIKFFIVKNRNFSTTNNSTVWHNHQTTHSCTHTIYDRIKSIRYLVIIHTKNHLILLFFKKNAYL